ncbi:rod shape-determining protein MreD [Staphylococcus simulans]|uniref:rod shape-determining protein MreD n=1 Tax=Staphylococcus TaxID=1279 RepID=UPI0007643F27|nr:MULTISPECIES: rod shape-determining protein MreD [Staphylococcus]KXA41084.1 rod shape-determining protein MreD [Staphylococcus simulans]MBO0386343.1 rod shape-determining protein MreD [Staphylococcus simulans]MBU6944083.1 rod shape-determining protein MreD [Staphylococcus sp. CWZ226]MDK7928155.1 rod shape-determining protein MreD [Staphylococcus simulans]MDK8316811.1 rod shape-determining protein MreD [Staphylococcus simulans]
MRAFYYFLIGAVLFYLDSLIALVIPMQIGGRGIIFVPHLLLMYLLIITIYKKPSIAVVLAIIFGLTTDLYYGTIYGLNTFGYLLFVILMDFFFKVYYRDHTMVFIGVWLFTIIFEIYQALIYGLLGLIKFNLWDFLLFRLLPTAFVNLLLLVIVFSLIKKLIKKLDLPIDRKA